MILFFSRILTAKGRPESKSWANLTLPKLPSPNVLPSSYLPSRIPSCFFSAITIHCITSRPSNKLSKIGFCIRVYPKLLDSCCCMLCFSFFSFCLRRDETWGVGFKALQWGASFIWTSWANEMNAAAYCVSIDNWDFETPKTEHNVNKSTTALFYFSFIFIFILIIIT